MSKYDYGVVERGFSYEYVNLFQPAQTIFNKDTVLLFDFIAEYKQLGKQQMNANLLETVKREKPDAAIFCLFENEFDETTLTEIRKLTKTAAYFFDDPWRQTYVRHWIKYVDYFSTPDYYRYQTYLMEHITNVIYTPFGFNPQIFKKLQLEPKYDVSFVGGFSPLRQWAVDRLEQSGIKVAVFGRGWGSRYPWISTGEMVQVFNQSKINLNISNAFSFDPGALFTSLKSVRGIKHLLLNRKTKEQVKGRHYEINGCGGFQLSYFIPGLNTIYQIDKEIAVYEDIRSLPAIIEFFLQNDGLREQIARAGYERSIKDHNVRRYLENLVSHIINGSGSK